MKLKNYILTFLRKKVQSKKKARSLWFLVTKPEIFIIFCLIYLVLGILVVSDAYLLNIDPNLAIDSTSIGIWFFGLIFYWLGLKYYNLLFKTSYLPIFIVFILGSVATYYILNINFIFSIFLNLLAIILCFIVLNFEKIVNIFSKVKNQNCFEFLFVAGFIAFIFNFLLTGIPLLRPELHSELFRIINPLFIFGFFAMLYSLIKLYPNGRILFLLLLFLTLLSTYRVYMGIAFFAWLFLELKALSKTKRKSKPIIFIVVASLCAILFFFYVGYILTIDSKLDVFRAIEYRLAFTWNVFNDVVKLSFPFGYTFGKSLTMEATQFTCQMLYNCNSRITSTLFGEAMLDFGLIGIAVVIFFIANILRKLWEIDYPLYCMLLASLIVSIEVGINVFLILLYIYLGYLRVLSWKKYTRVD